MGGCVRDGFITDHLPTCFCLAKKSDGSSHVCMSMPDLFGNTFGQRKGVASFRTLEKVYILWKDVMGGNGIRFVIALE